MNNVDINSIVISGINMNDYPKFCDAFIESANHLDGTPLTEDELNDLSDDQSLVHELVMREIF